MKKLLFACIFTLAALIGKGQNITVTYPNGGETLAGCSNRTITWTHSSTSGYFNVEYSTNNGSTWASLATNYTGSSLSWTIPNISSTQAIIRVSDYSNSAISDVSNFNFIITPSLVVTQPNGGESWQVANPSTRTITWDGFGTSNSFSLEYSINGGSSWNSITSGTFTPSGNTYSYNWNIPNNPSGFCLVKVTDNNSAACKNDVSDNIFSIVAPSPIINITSPNGGNTLYVGQSHSITWTSAYLSGSFVKIEYSTNNGVSWSTIISSTNNTGSYSWTNIPNEVSNSCLIKISDVGNPSTFDISDAVFNISLGTITVISPNGGEILNGCQTSNITWTRQGTSNYFNLDYSTDNGVTWNFMASNYYQSGTNCSYSWTIPNISSTQALVRVYDFNNNIVKDSSNTIFTINPALTITAPNGGETWQGGTSRTITWTQGVGASNYWTIRYSTNSGNTWTTIVSNTYITNGQYVWNNIPNIPSGNCLIQVYDHQNSSCRIDASDNLFTITPASPEITVTSPNGGNTFYVGTSYNITWTSAYLNSPFVRLEYSIDNGATWLLIANSTNNDGSESWIVPNTPSSQCLVRVSEFGTPSVFDVSNAVFSIVYPYVEVTSPNGGENLTGCSSQNITWTSYGAGNGPWRVEYSNNNGVNWNILTSSTTSTSYTWSPVPNIPSSQNLIRVTKTSDPLVTDKSNNPFTIQQSISIVVNTPNGGEDWQVGDGSKTISWAWSGTSNYYNIYHSLDSGSTWSTIASNQYITNGQFAWTVPNNPTTNALIRVEDRNNTCRVDESDAVFTISPPQPRITVTSPNGGNVFYVGSAYNITWSSAYLSSNFVKIDYSTNNGDTWTTIFASTANDGSESWSVPNTPSENCLIRISEFGNPSVFDESNAVFTIRYPYVQINTPNGGESWNGCSSQSISWSSYGAGSGPWRVEYSINNGATWTILTNSTTSSSYTWNPVPNTPSANASVRVTKTTDALVKDTSDANFTITQNTAIVLTSPNGGESWQVANPTSRLITWTSSGVSNYYNIYYSIDNGNDWNTIVSNQYITSNQYSWTIPNNPTSMALIKVEDRNNTCKFDNSDAIFSIIAPEPVITVNSPNGGNTFYVGNSYNITWSSNYISSPFVTIQYSIDNGSTWTTIINSTNNDGSESWTVPNTPSSNCLVKVSEFGNPNVYDISNAVFSIVYPYVTLNWPNGGEIYAGCSSLNISWSSYGAGNGPWRVDYTTNNGSTWNLLVNGTTSSSYTWNPVINEANTNYKIRVRKTTDTLVTDVSDNPFTVTQNTAIVLNTPNGGENWQVGGGSQLIKWAWSGTSNYYNLYYSVDSGNVWNTIATNQYITNGQYSWAIPNNPSNRVLVRVEDYNNSCKYDISDQVFTISAPTPSITVNSPNGGNNFYVGTSYNITWSSAYLSSNFVTIEYSINNGSSWTSIFASTANDGSEAWTVPNMPSANCLIRVSEYGNPTVFDVSNNVFNIIYPYVTVNAPNGGEDWNGCSSQSISWSSYGAGSGPWRVEYTLDNGQTWTVLTNNSTSASYIWNPVPNTSSNHAKVRVTKTTDALVTDVSNAAFSVTPNTAIVITSPNGGENWQVANPNTRLITWTSSGVSNYYNFYYSINNGQTWNIITSGQYITNNQYSWTIPNNPSTQVLVKVEDYYNMCKYDISDAVFTIEAPTPVITVTAPNGGNTYYVGTSYNITWSSQYVNSSFVKLEYSTDNGATWFVITPATANDNSESWLVPNTPSSNCLVRVSEYGNPAVFDVSNNVFSIVSPYIRVNSPNSGENIVGCSSYNIYWSGFGTGSGPYRVEYSTDNGTTWNILTNSTTSSGYAWNPIPNISTNLALIRVSLTNNATVNDVSDMNFSLNQQTHLIINSPNGGEEWQVANPSSQVISWASSGVSRYYNIYYSINGGTSWNTIITNHYNTSNQYTWTLPNNPSNNAMIMIEDYNNTCKNDISDAPFTILAPTPTITVNAPNGGQTLYSYNNYNITWSSAYLASSFVKIDYSLDSGSTWINIISSTNNSGSYTWNVPNISTSNALIRVSDFGNNATYDESNAVFAIKPAVRVTAPNGDENLGGCTVTTITWEGESSSGSYNLQYSINGGNTWTTIASQTFSGGPNFSYNWTLPNTPSNYCLVKVTHNSNSNKTDQSDAVFKIEPTITVTNPNNGGSYAVGSILNLTWTAQGVSNYYNIDFSTNGGSTWNTIAFNQHITTNSYSWTVPSTITSNGFIRVIDNNNTCKQDLNDLAFTIANAPASIMVTSPNGGENWQVCSDRTITWSANNTSGTFKIEYSSNNGSSWTTLINNYSSSNGNYAWTVPNTPTTQGLFRVSDASNASISDVSNSTFTVSSLATPGTISGNTTVCEGSLQTYTVPLVTGATSYTWTLPSGWSSTSTSNTINVVVGNTGGNITVKANNSCSSSAVSLRNITVTPLPQTPGIISGNLSPCQGLTEIYNISPVANATSYTWLLPSGYSGSSNTNSINVNIGSSIGSITVFGVNSCGTGLGSQITINPNGNSVPLRPGNIIGEALVCANSTQTYTVSPVSNATSYTWTLPNGWTGTSSSNSITTTIGSTGGSISVVANNSCGISPSQSLSVSIQSLPTQPGIISGNSVVCQNSTNTYSIANISNATSYTWTLPTGWTGVSSTTAISAVAAGITGNVSVVANNACGSSAPRTLAVTVNTPLTPSVSIARNPNGAICSNTNVVFTATPVNGGTPTYQWVKNNVSVGSNSPTYSSNNWNPNDSVWVLMTSGLSCVTSNIVTSNSIIMNVTPVVVPTITISTESTSICAGQNVTFEAIISGGGSNPTFQWRKNGANISGANSSTYTTNSIINGETYSCVLTSSAPCASPLSVTSNSLNMSVSNNFISSVSIAASPNGAVCSGTPITFTANPSNGGSTPTFQWTVNGVEVETGNTFISNTLNNQDTVRCLMTSSLACFTPAVASSNSIITNINQNVYPEVSITTDNNPICLGQSVTYTATPLYGGTAPTYQWRKNGINISGANNPSYTTTSINNGDNFDVILTSNYTCKLSNKDTSDAITLIVSDMVTPTVSIVVSPSNSICIGSNVVFTATPLNGGSLPSYQWRKNGINITGANAPTYSSTSLANGDIISVVMTSNSSCASPNTATSNPITMNVYGNTVASVSISGTPSSPICTGANVAFTTTTLNGGTLPEYQWLKNGTPISGANSPTYQTSELIDGDVISVRMTTNKPCATPAVSVSNSLTYSINTIPETPSTISGNITVCQGQQAVYSVTPISGATSYLWILPNGWTGTSTSNSITATIGASSGNISVSAHNSCGSSSVTSLYVNVNPLPDQPEEVSGLANVCSGISLTYSTNLVPHATSYTWTLPSGWIGNSISESIDVTSGSNSGTISVKANNSCGSSVVRTFNVNSSSVPNMPTNIIGNTTVCNGTTQIYSTPVVSGATSYTWNLPSGWSGISTSDSIVTTAGINGGTISVTANNQCGSSNAKTSTITVNTIPSSPGIITGNESVCEGVQYTYSISPVSGATSYQWILPSGWIGSSTTNSINIRTNSSSGNIQVLAVNSCGNTTTSSKTITVNPIPSQPSIINGNTNVCSSSQNTYSTPIIPNATSYTWTLPSGWVGTSTTNIINVTAGTLSGNITVKANNTCGSSSVQTMLVNVSSIPSVPSSIIGNANICSSTQQTYSILPVNGATSYTWTLPSGWAGNSTTDSIDVTSGVNSGNITVTANNHCGSSAVQTIAITVTSIPNAPTIINGNTSVCEGTINTYSTPTVSGATFYTWTLPNGWTGTSTSNSINATTNANNGNVSVAAGNACGVSAAISQVVNINPLPLQPGTISGNTEVCANTSQQYSIAEVSNATSYTWTLPSGWVGTSTTNTIDVTAGTLGGNITVKANNTCGSSSVQTMLVNVSSIPSVPSSIIGNANICSSTQQTYSILPVNGATSYTWTLPSGWAGSSTADNIDVTSGVNGGNITVTANNHCGSSTAQTIAITVTSIPNAPTIINGNASVCEGTINTYSTPTVSGATFYTWTLPNGWTGTSTSNSINATTNANNGNVSVAAGNACGVSAAISQVVNINPLPLQPGTISGNTEVCANTSQQYSIAEVNNATSYTWTLPSGWVGTSTTNIINVTAGTLGGNITVKANNACGSSDFQNIAVVVSSAPNSPSIILGSEIICAGSQQTYSVEEVNAADYYIWTLPNGWSGSSTTQSIDVESNSNAGSILVAAANYCGISNATSLDVSVNSLPDAAGLISGNTAPCIGVSEIYSCPAVTGATSYTWILPSGFTGISNTNSIEVMIGSNPGNIQVFAVNDCGQGAASTLLISPNGNSVLQQPAVISGPSTICATSTNIYSIPLVAGATSYTWIIPSGWSGTSTSNSISITSDNNSGQISVVANNECGSSIPRELNVQVNTIPETPGIISGDADVCANSSEIYSIAEVDGATSYTWVLPLEWTGNSSGNSIEVGFGVNNGNISVIANNSCGTSLPQTIVITVHNPAAPIISVNSNVLSSSYATNNQWYFNNAAIPNATNQTHIANFNGYYHVVYTDGFGCEVSSDTIYFQGVGISEVDNNNLKIYPNPSKGIFNLEWNDSHVDNLNISIYNHTGAMIYQSEHQNIMSGEIISIQLENVSTGVYMMQIISPDKVMNKKIVIQK